MYVKEGRLVGGNTPTSIPEKYKPLLKFKYFCKFCGDYHSHSAGFKFCDKNPDKEIAIENARNKAAYHYYKKGRKQELQNGWNVNRDKIVDAIHRISPEIRAKINEAVRIANTGKKLSQEHKDKLVEFKRKAGLTKERIEESLEKNGITSPVFVSHNFEEIFAKPKQFNKDGFIIEEEQFDRQEYTIFDNFSNKHYDIDGDFDPFS